MTEDELLVYAESLYEIAANQAQLEADDDVDRQIRVANGLLEKPAYSSWSALPQYVKGMWLTLARQLSETAEVHDAILGGV